MMLTGTSSTVVACILHLTVIAMGEDVRLPPSITYVSPSQYFLDAYTEVKLYCEANGSPKPKYIWRHDGNPLVQSQYVSYNEILGNLTIYTPTRVVEGMYQCEASNKWGTSVSQPTYLTQARIGYFKNDSVITNYEVREGEHLSLPCSDPPSSTPQATYIWYTGDKASSIEETKRISVDSKGTLHFAYTMQSDSTSSYACGVKNIEVNSIRLGSKIRISFDTGIPASLKEIKLLSATYDVQALLGQSVTLECIFAGKPTPDVVWTRLNKQLQSNEKFTIESFGRKLTINNINEGDEGEYICGGFNTNDREEVALKVNVTSPPIWVRPLVSQHVIEGQDAYFFCTAQPSSQEMIEKPIWYINGSMLNPSKGVSPSSNIKVYENYLKVEKVSRDRDLMCIQCNVSNSVGFVFRDVFLNVLEPIRIHDRPADYIYFNPGTLLNFTITATTDPSRNVERRWYLNNTFLILNQPYFDYDAKTGIFLFNTSQLSPEKLSAMIGTYKCQLYHQDQSINVSITIGFLNVTVSKPESKNVTTGNLQIHVIAGSCILFLLVFAIVVAAVIWYKRNPKAVYNVKGKEKHHFNLTPIDELETEEFKNETLNESKISIQTT